MAYCAIHQGRFSDSAPCPYCLQAQLQAAQVVINEKQSRIKEAEDLSWKNWRDREEAYAEMRVTREERDAANLRIRELEQERDRLKEARVTCDHCTAGFNGRHEVFCQIYAYAEENTRLQAQLQAVTQNYEAKVRELEIADRINQQAIALLAQEKIDLIAKLQAVREGAGK